MPSSCCATVHGKGPDTMRVMAGARQWNQMRSFSTRRLQVAKQCTQLLCPVALSLESVSHTPLPFPLSPLPLCPTATHTHTCVHQVTYPLHIILRYEVERGLLDGSIKVDDVPAVWNAKMKQYLSVEPPTDAQGCLQVG